jgi:hypothetical protein
MEEEEQNSLVGWELQHPGCDFAVNNSIPLEFCPCSKVQCECCRFLISLWHCPPLQSQQQGIHHLALLSMFPQLVFHHYQQSGLPWWLRWYSACNAGDPGLIPGYRRYPGEENSCSILVWRIQQIDNLVGYSSWVCKELDLTERLTLSLWQCYG